MHILLIHQAFASIREPGGTRHHEMARYLAARGHRMTILTGQSSYLTGRGTRSKGWLAEEVDIENVTILRTYTFPGWHRSFFHRVLTFLSFMLSSFVAGWKVKDVDLLWGTSPPIFQGLSAWSLARLKRAKFLFEVRDLWPSFAIAIGVLRSPLLIALSRWLEGFLYRRADGVVVNSPGFISHVTRRGAKQVELVPNGVDLSVFDMQADGEAFRAKEGLEGKFIVMYAGAHGVANDLGVILEAASLLREELGLAFVLIGDGKEKANLISRAESWGLQNLHFLMPVPKVEMPSILAAADACIAVLKPIDAFRTTYPNKVFDYMAAGRPVILAIDGVIREVLEQAKAGIFTPPGDPARLAETVRHMMSHPVEANEMGRSGRKYVEENFSRSNLVAEMERVMKDVVER
jgi:glycosyltransferase involved in cell wall biosynthesis